MAVIEFYIFFPRGIIDLNKNRGILPWSNVQKPSVEVKCEGLIKTWQKHNEIKKAENTLCMTLALIVINLIKRTYLIMFFLI
jgi:hypothetical protein